MRRNTLAKAFTRIRIGWGHSASLYVGTILIVSVALVCLITPVISPWAPDQIIPEARLQPPSLAHPLGTDPLGRDLLVRLAVGGHIAAQMTMCGVGIAMLIGINLGSIAGYFRGKVDQLLSRLMDAWLSLPGVLVAIILVARLGVSLTNLILALGFMATPVFYRVVRSTVLSTRQMPFVEASIATGATSSHVIRRHILPNIVSPLVVLTSTQMAMLLLTGSSLSFIGLGAQPPTPEWGALLASGKNYIDTAWWLAAAPGLAVTMTVLGLTLIGDGLRDRLDPHSRQSSLLTFGRKGGTTPAMRENAGTAVTVQAQASTSPPRPGF